jgi:hypothetical protein
MGASTQSCPLTAHPQDADRLDLRLAGRRAPKPQRLADDRRASRTFGFMPAKTVRSLMSSRRRFKGFVLKLLADCAIERRSPDAHDPSHVRRTLASLNHFASLTNLGRFKRRRSTDVLASTLGGTHPRDRPLAENVPLELRDGAQDGVEHLAGRGRCVDVLRERAQRNAPIAQHLGHLEQMPQRPPQPVELPDDEGIAGAQLSEGAIELRPRSERPALFVLEDPLAAGGLEGVELQAGGLDVG